MLQFRNRFGGWRLLANAVRPLLEQAPELTDQQARLEELIREADGLVNQQEEMRAKLRQATHRRQEVEREGEDLRLRITAALQNRFGFHSDVLLAYGVAPRQKRDRRTKAEVELDRLKLFLRQLGVEVPVDLPTGAVPAVPRPSVPLPEK